MKYLFRGENIEVTEALKEYTMKRMEKLEKYFHEDADVVAHVTMKVYRDGQRVEVTVPTPGLILRAEDKTDDMYAAIDNVVEKLGRQIRKYKTRVNRKAREHEGLGSFFSQAQEAHETNGEALGDETRIMRVKRFPLKPMNVEEAVLQMDLLGHNFFVFQNAETDDVGIVYKRRDGTYGLIEPEF
ncbi:MAG: ribosome-associated translation inhibitor RaiA [Candidatus Carbobacillus altaicus]|uniref:Ribosome hibernation promoting factor n=1 Tax=Candidatus Carbonibacillus altaicus TaxID=2163959 RepID=A0A2R6Y081_9BACL|nr:ribosome-associated translation inhibitor RaiA [Candidatus Carbobacillus altaicus]PTQ56077.1 MAG: Ribosomal subunit interface protein [Candidatus Carbobacillus altaicus]